LIFLLLLSSDMRRQKNVCSRL